MLKRNGPLLYRKKVVFSATVLLLSLMPQRASGISLTPVAGYALPNGSMSPSLGISTSARSYSFCYGGWVDFKMFRTLFMEVGALYISRGFKQTTLESITELTFNSVEIPVLLRYFLLPSMSVGLGAYFAHGFGSYHMTTNSISTASTYSPSTYGADDYGGVVSMSFRFKLLFMTSLVVDGRFLYGFQNLSPSTSEITTLSDLQVLAGIQFGI